MTAYVPCPRCHGVGIVWRRPVSALAVVREFPTLHGLADRKTVSVWCSLCKGSGAIDLAKPITGEARK